ncbi:hypothetical protein ACWDWS_02445 [Streptomyces sp. NPDC003328]
MGEDNPFTRERRYFGDRLADEHGRAYANVIGTMTGIAYRSEGAPRWQKRLCNARVDGMRMAAVEILKADPYNTVTTEETAEWLVNQHVTHFREAIEKDEKERQGTA